MEEIDTVGTIAVVLFFIVGSAIVGYFAASITCEQKFKDFSPEFNIIGGCMVTHKGLKIPSDNFRLID